MFAGRSEPVPQPDQERGQDQVRDARREEQGQEQEVQDHPGHRPGHGKSNLFAFVNPGYYRNHDAITGILAESSRIVT
jgi:hypothetical protein